MSDLTRNSDRVLEDARRLRDDNRAGGRHRRAPSIGKGSKQLKQKHWVKKLRNIVVAIFTIWVASGIVGFFVNGIGILGVMAVIIASCLAVALFSSFPRFKTPKRAELNRGDVKQLVGRTELWLEAQRPALPPPAVTLVDQIGVQLDGLGFQLEGLDQNHPKAREVRSLVGEQLPEMIDSYRRIPAQLRTEQRAGSTPDAQLTESLSKISGEIDSITRQLAEGSLDDLAIKHRYLDYKFGTGAETSPELEHKT